MRAHARWPPKAPADAAPAEKLLPDPVHLLAHDAHDLVERPITQKKVRVNPRRQLPNVTSPHQKLVAGHFRVSGSLAQCRNKQF